MPISKATSNAAAPAAKGDLVVGNATNDSGVLAVGTTDQVLVVDSTTATGLKWATPAANSMTLITSGSLAATGNTTISSISGSYKDLIVYIKNYVNQSDYLGLRINGVSSANSHFYRIGSGASAASSTYLYAAQYTNNTSDKAFGKLEFPDYTNTTTPKSYNIYYNMTDTAGTSIYSTLGSGAAKATTAITSLVFFPVSGTIVGGTYEVYGVN